MPPPVTLRASLNRAAATTARTFKFQKPRELVTPVVVFVVTLALFYWREGKGPLLEQVGWYLAVLGATVAASLVLFFINLARAPGQLYNEAYAEVERRLADYAAEIEVLRAAAARKPDLAIEAQHAYIVSTDASSGVGWIITLQDILITNRSKTEQVSLSFQLDVALTGRTDRLTLLEHQHAGMVRDNPPDLIYLHGPLDIPPQKSRTGRLGFLVLPFQVEDFGGQMSAINELDAVLNITDHVTGKTLPMRVPERRSVWVSS
jgi:hypothetical protein